MIAVPTPTSFLALDYSQIEMRLTAHESQDAAMLDIFRDGKDIHSMASQWIFGDITKEHRYPVKRAGFGIIYMISPMGLATLLKSEGLMDWGEAQCAELIDAYYILFPGLQDMQCRFIKQATDNGFVTTFAGRRIQVPEVYSVHDWVREAGFRQAANAPIQGGAADIIKEAMAALTPVWPLFHQPPELVCRPLLQVHDELLWEVSDNQLMEVAAIFKELMESAAKLSIPIKCDVEVGKSWGELKEINLE